MSPVAGMFDTWSSTPNVIVWALYHGVPGGSCASEPDGQELSPESKQRLTPPATDTPPCWVTVMLAATAFVRPDVSRLNTAMSVPMSDGSLDSSVYVGP